MSNALLADGAAAPGETLSAARRRPRRLMLAAGAIAFLLLLIYLVNWYGTARFVVSTDDAYIGGNVTDLAPQVSGPIVKIDIVDNQFVRAGTPLLQIDNRVFVVAEQKAEAEISASQATLADLAATRNLQNSLIDEARADAQAANAQAILAGLNQVRYARLAATQAGSVQDSQVADANGLQARAAVAKAQAQLAAAQAQMAVIAAEEVQTNAALAGARADRAAALLNLDDTTIRAPFDGMVGNRSAHLGGYATAGAQLVSMIPASGLWVDANFKEDQLRRIRPGQLVRIDADIDPGLNITGHVQNISPASGAVFSILPAENATGNFTKIVQRVPVRITLDGDAAILGLLRPGLSVTASIDTK